MRGDGPDDDLQELEVLEGVLSEEGDDGGLSHVVVAAVFPQMGVQHHLQAHFPVVLVLDCAPNQIRKLRDLHTPQGGIGSEEKPASARHHQR